MLIYDVTAPITALILYNHLLWDGKPSKKNQWGKIVERKERDTLLLVILLAFQIAPPVLMTSVINLINIKQEQINPDLFSKDMLEPFDETYGESYLMLAAASIVLIMGWVYSQIKAVFKRRNKNEDVEPDD